MKYLAPTVIAFSVFLFIGFAPIVSAQDYRLLQPLPRVETTPGTTAPAQYISGMFMLIIGIAGVLAVIMIIVGGIKYMTTDAIGAKSEAKKTIQDAIFGLLLALGAWIILYSIGGDRLTNFTISLDTIPAVSTTTPTGTSFGQPWPPDTDIRQYLTGTLNIQINRNNCATIGQTACTSVSGLSTRVINGLVDLIVACDAVPLYSTAGCTPRITGGTEYWLHGNRSTELTGPEANTTSHRPGGNVVDLGLERATLNNYIMGGTILDPRSGGCSNIGSAKYSRDGVIFVHEGTHWHVCF